MWPPWVLLWLLAMGKLREKHSRAMVVAVSLRSGTAGTAWMGKCCSRALPPSGSAHNSSKIILELWTGHFGLFRPLAELWRGEMFLSKSYHLPGWMGFHMAVEHLSQSHSSTALFLEIALILWNKKSKIIWILNEFWLLRSTICCSEQTKLFLVKSGNVFLRVSSPKALIWF